MQLAKKPPTKQEACYHTATLKRTSSKIETTRQKAWRTLGNIASMPKWAPGVSSVEITTPHKSGIGAVRLVKFADGRSIEEHITSWDACRGFTYVATDGLPLRAYVATIAISDTGSGVKITWQSYLASTKMTKAEFAGIVNEMGMFYQESLSNLGDILHENAKGFQKSIK